MPRFRPCAFLTLSLLALGSGSQLAADQRPFEELLPEDVTLFLSLRSVSQVQKWAEGSPLAGVWRSPEMESFSKQISTILEKQVMRAEKEVGNLREDIVEVCRGEVALSVGGLEKLDRGSPDIPVAVLVDISGNRDKGRDLVERLIERATREGKTRRREDTFRSRKILILEKEVRGDESDEKKEEKAKEAPIAVSILDDVLVIAGSRSFLEQIIVTRGEGPEKSLGARTDFRNLREKYGKDAAVFAYADIAKFYKAMPALASRDRVDGSAGQKEMQQVLRVLDILGLSGIQALAYSVTLSPKGIEGTMFCLAPSSPKGLVKAMWTKPTALRFSGAIPDDVCQAMVLQVDFDAVFQCISELARLTMVMVQERMSGGRDGAPAQMDPVKLAEQQLGINLQQDLVSTLSGQIVFYERLQKPFTESSGKGAVLVELRDKDRLQATIEKLLGLAPIFRRTTYLGRPIYGLSRSFDGGADEDEGRAEGGAEPEDSEPALGISDAHLVFGMGRDMVEEAIRRVGKEVKSLGDAPGFRAVADELPSSSIFIAYQSPDVIEYIIHFLKEEAASGEGEYGVGGGRRLPDDEGNDSDEESEDEPDEQRLPDPASWTVRTAASEPVEPSVGEALRRALKALPDPSVIAKLFAGGVSYGFVEERGLGLTSKVLFRKR